MPVGRQRETSEWCEYAPLSKISTSDNRNHSKLEVWNRTRLKEANKEAGF